MKPCGEKFKTYTIELQTTIVDILFLIFSSIEVDMKNTVYCQAMEYGSDAEWNFLMNRYEASNVATEKRDLQGGLTCTKEIWLLNK